MGGFIWLCGAPNGIVCRHGGCKTTLYDFHRTGCPRGTMPQPIDSPPKEPEKQRRTIGDVWASGRT